MLIYVARPNDHAKDYAIRTRRALDTVEFALAHRRAAWYDPIKPFVNPMEAPQACWSINEAALHAADGVLAVYPAGVPSTGVPMEIQSAYNAGKPLVVVGGHGSMQLKGMGVELFEEGHEWQAVERLAQLVAGRTDDAYELTPVRWAGPKELEPVRKYDGDAGFDIYCAAGACVRPGHFVDIPCDIRVQLPPSVWAMVVGRSSTLRKRGLFVPPAIVDNGYRGPMFVGTWNLGEDKQQVAAGDRIAQLIPFPLTAAGLRLVRVASLGPGDRGEAGFGSTGG